jgi:nucleoside 2-deoxyribosyltransferase
MDIYFACALTGGRAEQAEYAQLVAHLQAQGHRVPTAHLALAAGAAEEAALDAAAVYGRDIGWLEAADAVVAEVSTPSHGVGYEIAHALQRGKRVLCVYRAGARVSKMLLGNSERRLTVAPYATMAEALQTVDSFLQRADAERAAT